MYTTSDVMILNAIVEWAKWLNGKSWRSESQPARHCRKIVKCELVVFLDAV